MWGQHQGLVNQIFGVPCKQCYKSESRKTTVRQEHEQGQGQGLGRGIYAEAEGNAHADKENADGLQCARMHMTHKAINI